MIQGGGVRKGGLLRALTAGRGGIDRLKGTSMRHTSTSKEEKARLDLHVLGSLISNGSAPSSSLVRGSCRGSFAVEGPECVRGEM
jgi:hypothetical protein